MPGHGAAHEILLGVVERADPHNRAIDAARPFMMKRQKVGTRNIDANGGETEGDGVTVA
jgi:hypothetical protein